MTPWTITATARPVPPFDPDPAAAADRILGDRILAAAVITGTTGAPDDLVITVTLDAYNIRDAIAIVHRRITAALATYAVVGIAAATEDDADRQAEHPYPRLVGITEAAAILGVTRQRVHTMTKSARFPRPIAVLASGPVFDEDHITAYAAPRIAAAAHQAAVWIEQTTPLERARPDEFALVDGTPDEAAPLTP